MHRVRMHCGALGGRRRAVRVASVPRPVLRTGCISNVGGPLWALHDAVRRGTLTFTLWDAAQRCTVLYSFPQCDSVGPKIRNC